MDDDKRLAKEIEMLDINSPDSINKSPLKTKVNLQEKPYQNTSVNKPSFKEAVRRVSNMTNVFSKLNDTLGKRNGPVQPMRFDPECMLWLIE